MNQVNSFEFTQFQFRAIQKNYLFQSVPTVKNWFQSLHLGLKEDLSPTPTLIELIRQMEYWKWKIIDKGEVAASHLQ